MKRIGLLGGTGWPSTIEYYRVLNEKAQEYFGDGHSAKLLLWSIDYYEIRQHYPNGWDKINSILQSELESLNKLRPSCIVICNNTLHESYDAIKGRVKLDVPVIHMADLTAEYLGETGCGNALLTGTRRTMECGYYLNKLKSKGIRVTIPNVGDRVLINSMQQSIAKGESVDGFEHKFIDILSGYSECDVVITACTELPIVITPKTTSLKIIDPLQIQCSAAFEYAVA